MQNDVPGENRWNGVLLLSLLLSSRFLVGMQRSLVLALLGACATRHVAAQATDPPLGESCDDGTTCRFNYFCPKSTIANSGDPSSFVCGGDGAPCIGDDYCTGGYCGFMYDGATGSYTPACADPYANSNGEPCQEDANCASRFCAFNLNEQGQRADVCREPGQGELGSRCLDNRACSSSYCSYTVDGEQYTPYCTQPGLLPLYNVCRYSTDCASGSCNATLGDPAGQQADFAYLGCTNGEAQLPVGTTCTSSAECLSGYCGGFVGDNSEFASLRCTTPGSLEEGQRCFYDDDCVDGTTCGRVLEEAVAFPVRKCSANADQLPLNSYCFENEDCASNFCGYVYDLTNGGFQTLCTTPGQLEPGTKCRSDGDCSTGYCGGGVANDGSESRICLQRNSGEEGDPCFFNADCASELCAYLPSPDDSSMDTLQCTTQIGQQQTGEQCNSDAECASGTCGAYTDFKGDYFDRGVCGPLVEAGDRCRIDSDCASGSCSLANAYDPYTTCADTSEPPPDPPSPSQHARQKRRIELAAGMAQKPVAACPAGLTVCSLGALAGFECVDTSSSLEHCGGCSNAKLERARGVDCSEIVQDGALSVACIRGHCVATACDADSVLTPRGECVSRPGF